ncbi:nickel uptake transporter family protein [Novosphingobium barchaimii LL02]|uniref:Nickel uptake transporter family protein n=1 Tax=Novosphingobium barchaimii LL02 TaxID=1114963 RepID=A0A0J7XSY6_9SPHN|nr:DUF4198 domain-containing protein [Novosphingobium barchaimii]KMS54789.1 nickel uptake transporter family protein [Novosphingobium barchaimii LL02]
MRFRTFLIAAAVSSALATPALAHRMWLLPSTTTLAGTSEYVTVDAAVSNDLFYPDHMALDPAQVSVWAPDGSEGKVENPSKGRYRGTFDVAIDKPGTWKIGMNRSSIGGTFKVGAEQWRVGGRGRPAGPPGAPGAGGSGAGGPGAGRPGGPGGPGGQPPRMVATVADIPANATDIKLSESLTSYAIYVSSDAPTKGVLTPTGKGLEFDPITHPDALVSDEEASFRFLIDGKPAAGVKVTLIPGGKKYREAEDGQELTTGADGVLRIKWPVAGMYWMSASAEDNKPSDKRAQTRRMSFSSTLEVVAP